MYVCVLALRATTPCFPPAQAVTTISQTQAAIDTRVSSLESEISELKALLKAAGIGGVAAAGVGPRR